MTFVATDGGRVAAGFPTPAGDAVIRAVAIATELPYLQVHDELMDRQALQANGSATRGISADVARGYLTELGWLWTPTLIMGAGSTMFLRPAELPMGRIICALSRHYVAVIDRVIHDLQDPSQGGKRRVIGYWSR